MNITFKGYTPETFGAWLASIPVLTPSTKNRNTWIIPNRNGDLLETNFSRSNATWDVLIHMKNATWAKNKRAITKWLNGTGKLIMSDTTDSFYEVLDVTITEDFKRDETYGRIRAIFTVYPYEFLVSGDTGVTSFPINNTAQESAPLYKITGTGSGTLTVNSHSMTYTADGVLYIDTRRFIAYDGSNNDKESSINGDYAGLRLQEGSNTISCTHSLTVYPKWGYNI